MDNANRLADQSKPRGLFVIGTDTEVGKTYVACLLAKYLNALGHKVGVYKPVASGLSDEILSDAERLRNACGTDWPIDRICPQSFAAPLAPPVAAELEGKSIDKNKLVDGARWWFNQCDTLIIEGAGGALSPIAGDWTVLDLARRTQLPLLLVAANRLGVVNHVLLTIEAAKNRRLPVPAIVLNNVSSGPSDSAQTTNKRLLERFAPNHTILEINHGTNNWPSDIWP